MTSDLPGPDGFRIFHAPGRVNLIGEHTDYNGGFALPAALSRGVTVAARIRTDRTVIARSNDFGEQYSFPIDGAPGPSGKAFWTDHLVGMVTALASAGEELSGADLRIISDLPAGAGLGSSAAFKVAVGYALCALAGKAPEPLTLARAAQEAEREFAGVDCGIMDPLASICGQEGCALWIDCAVPLWRAVALPADRLALLVVDSGVRHVLAASQYNRRRADCAEAVRRICLNDPAVSSLRQVSLERLDRSRDALGGVLYRRARHVVTENGRVQEAVDALSEGRLWQFGATLRRSHESLREDYDVSTPELDDLVGSAMAGGAYGARMTGGGFGGSIIVAAPPTLAAPLSERIVREFQAHFGRLATVTPVRASRGVSERART